jgi:hypothetical protein
MKNLSGKIIFVVLAVGLGAGVWWQAHANALLREERTRLQAQAVELARLRAAQVQQRAANPSSLELDALQREVDEAAALRSRIELLKAAQVQAAPAPKPAQVVVPTKAESTWHNAGQATPADTLHTVIWTAMNGDVDALMSMLAFDSESRAAAEGLLASLSEANRAQYPTVEKLIATMVSGRMPVRLVQSEVIEQTGEGTDRATAKIRLKQGFGELGEPTRDVTFSFQRNGSDWQLFVPASVIAAYKKSLETR